MGSKTGGSSSAPASQEVTNNSSSNQVVFAIAYTVADTAFERAARTWLNSTGGTTMLEMVTTETDFRRAWSSILQKANRTSAKISAGAIFSHASKGSSSDGLEFKPSDTDDGTLNQSEILAMDVLPWASGAVLTLHGCNTGLTGKRGWCPAETFARAQKVITDGMSGYGYFSTKRETYDEISGSDTAIYLWAYKRGKNGTFGSGERMPARRFSP